MITAKSLEKRLRELRVWTQFQKNKANTNIPYDRSYYYALLSAFNFKGAPEGSDYWWNIADKIDEVKL